jgi:hypothetical protein
MTSEEELNITSTSTPVAKALAYVVKMMMAFPTKHVPLNDLRQIKVVGVLSYCDRVPP